MTIIRKIDDFIARIEGWILIGFLGALTFFSALDVFLGLFASGLGWINRFFGYSLLWLALVGASVATHDNRHITIDIFSRILPPQVKRFSMLFIQLVGFRVGYVFARESYSYIIQIEKPTGDLLFSIGFDVYNWTLYMIIPIAFMSIGVRFLLAAINNFLVIVGLAEPPEERPEPLPVSAPKPEPMPGETIKQEGGEPTENKEEKR